MRLQQIITLANQPSRIQFVAMERSLRAVGCRLPLLVIPYDDRQFDLPANANWWKVPAVWDWLRAEHAHPMMSKYQCLNTSNYQYVDTDICFVRNPEDVLIDQSGWVVACTDWSKPQWTYTPESASLMAQRTSTWLRSVFNAGQFACDQSLYNSPDEMKRDLLSPDRIETCLRCKIHDQPGLNLLIFMSGIKITNLTLPPHRMESTWAGGLSRCV